MKRYNTTQSGYRFDKFLVWGFMMVIITIAFLLAASNDFDFSSTNVYIKCEEEKCENPLLNMQNCQQELRLLWVIPIYKAKTCQESCIDDWCKQPILTRGEYGKKPKGNFFFKNLFLITLSGIIAIIILNHGMHNRGKKFDFEIPFTKKHKLNFRDMVDRYEKAENNK